MHQLTTHASVCLVDSPVVLALRCDLLRPFRPSPQLTRT